MHNLTFTTEIVERFTPRGSEILHPGVHYVECYSDSGSKFAVVGIPDFDYVCLPRFAAAGRKKSSSMRIWTPATRR